MNRGKFIVIEGGDGSGKTTQIKLIQKSFKKTGIKTVYTREPGGTKLGEAIREILLHNKKVKNSSLTEAFLFNASRATWVEKIVAPNLKAGKTVLTDRSYPSTYAYQGVAGDVPSEQIDQLNKIAMSGMIPDLIIVIDLDYKTARERQKNAGIISDKIEARAKSYQEKVYSGFRQFAKFHANATLVDGKQSPPLVHRDIIKKINSRLKLKLDI